MNRLQSSVWPKTGVLARRMARLTQPLKARIRAALSHTDPPEVEQALIRFVAGLIVLCCFLTFTADGTEFDEREWSVLGATTMYVLLSIVVLVRVYMIGGISPKRRIAGMCVDNCGITFFMATMDAAGAVMFGLYLFVIFGNGFRYGRRYLHLCQAMMVTGFVCVLFASAFWSQHVAIGMGFLAGLVVLPFYVGVLGERLERAKSRADEANQAKGRFVANVSHEMRTPLNGVIAMADVLRETSLSDSQREIVETMTTSAELLLAQIEDVLDLSKIEANKVQIESRPMDLGRLLSSTVKVVLPQARFKGVPVHTDIAPDATGWFYGDSHHLRQVVLNLLSNAVKFTEKGSVTLRARCTDSGDQKKRIRFEVQDTGIGIPSEKQAAIFEPFTQADESITRIYGGTGLGTTIARQLVNLMGGKIGLTSEPFVGSLFWVELDLAPAAAPTEQEETSQSTKVAHSQALAAATLGKVHKLHGARILIAEDNATNQRVAQLILESAGHVVTIVANGEAALDALEKSSFDIALFDLSMPQVSGLEALKVYRFSTPKPIPVLILSANVTTETIAQCRSAGAAEFIPKPLRASHLLQAIERHLAQKAVQVAPPPAVRKSDERPVFEVVDCPPIDEGIMDDLSKLSRDPTFVVRLIEGFFSDADRLSREIVEALTNRQYETVRDAAHALKGGAGSVGAIQLVQFAKRLENAPIDSLRLRASQWIEELRMLDRQARVALSENIRRYGDFSAAPISGT